MAVSQSLLLTCTSQNTAQNTSQVLIQWSSTQSGASYNDNQRTAYYYVSVNGGAETQYSVNYTLPLQSTKSIVATTITVPHNDKGEATVTVRTWMNTHISAGVVEQKKSLTLPTIARESTVTGTTTTIGNSMTVTVNRKSTAFSHTVYLSFGSIGGYLNANGSLSGTAVKLTNTSITVPIGDKFYAQIPSAVSGSGTLTCTTYSGSTQIGSPKTAKFTLYINTADCYPELDCSVEDICAKTLGLTGDSYYIVRGYSTARVYAKAQARHSATIQSVTVNGRKITGDYLDIPNFPDNYLRIVATDSRGLSTTEIRGTIVQYTPVTLNATVERTDGTGSTATLKISGTCHGGAIGKAVNLLSASYRIGNGETVALITNKSFSGGTYQQSATVTGLEYNKTYSLTVTVSDFLTGVTRTLTVKKGEPVFDWGENDFAFHVPVTIMGNHVFGYVDSYIGRDFNDLILKNGCYAAGSAPADDLGCSNYPVKETGMLVVLSYGNFSYQIYMTYVGNAFYRTHWNNALGGWTAWKKVQMS